MTVLTRMERAIAELLSSGDNINNGAVSATSNPPLRLCADGRGGGMQSVTRPSVCRVGWLKKEQSVYELSDR